MKVFKSVLLFLFAGTLFTLNAGREVPESSGEPADREIRIPVATPDGFVNRANRLMIHDGVFTLIVNHRRVGLIYFTASTADKPYLSTEDKSFADGKSSFDKTGGVHTYTAELPGQAKLIMTSRVLPDGLIEIDAGIKGSPDVLRNVRNFALRVFVTHPAFTGKIIMAGGKNYCLSGGLPQNEILAENYKSAQEVRFAPDSPDAFSIFCDRYTLTNNRRRAGLTCLRKSASSKEVRIRIDLRKTEDSGKNKEYAGIDFYADDRLETPDFTLTRNLFPNPSFESGLRYYGLFGTWEQGNYLERNDFFSVTDKEAKFGKHCLKIEAPKGWSLPGFLQTSALPVKAGKDYVLSFYAKSDRPGAQLGVSAVTASWGNFPLGDHSRKKEFALTDHWTRYTVSLKTPNRGISFLLMGSSKDRDASIFLDGLQFEEGKKASPYTERSFCQYLKTDKENQGNFFNEIENIKPVLEITGPPGSKGKIRLILKDFFGRETPLGEFDFQTGSQGNAEIGFPLNDKIRNGVYVLRSELESGKFRDSDFFRVTRMKYLDNTQANKNFFSDCIRYNALTFKMLPRLKQIGIGSVNYHRPNEKTPRYFPLLKENGIDFLGTLTIYSDRDLYRKMEKLETVTPELEKYVEERSFQIAKQMPEIKIWALAGESERWCKLVRDGKFEEYAKLSIAHYKGTKRAIPDAVVLPEGCPCNLPAGIQVYGKYLEAARKLAPSIRFEAAGCNAYNATPEHADLDKALAGFLKVLDKAGYPEMPLYLQEGMYYSPCNIPEWGSSPYRGSTDKNRMYCPVSYDLGWGERIHAAYVARAWLAGLKYVPRVRQFNAWQCGRWWIDYDMTPLAASFAANTLGNLLGNAEFRKDIRFAPMTRVYVFEDSRKRPVAALWSWFDDVDHGLKKAPMANFHFSSEVEIFDLMGNLSRRASGSVELPMGAFPIFIRGKADSLNEFLRDMEKARMKIDVPVGLSLRLESASAAMVSIHNLISSPLSVESVLSWQGQTAAQNFSLPGMGSEKLALLLKEKVTNTRILQLAVDSELKTDGKVLKERLSLPCFSSLRITRRIELDGYPSDWKDIPAVPLRNRYVFNDRQMMPYKIESGTGDFDAEFKTAWDGNFFYLLVIVKDNKLVFNKEFSPRTGFLYDSLQVYFDTAADAREKVSRGYDDNDCSYDFSLDPDGKHLTAYRRNCVNFQLVAGVNTDLNPNTVAKEVKTAFSKISGGYVYEIAFPQDSLRPFLLRAHSVCGFSLFLNDNDGTGLRSALTLTPSQTSGCNTPHLYPVMILE